jgi:hypothetical protein
VRAWFRARPRGLLLAAGLLVISGSAAAAITLSGERSAPLSSIVPGGQQPNTALVAGDRYTIQITPSLQAGQISWCTSIRTYKRSGRPDDLGTGTCDDAAPTTGAPVFGTDNIDNGGGLSYVFTSSRVAGVRIAFGPTVLTRLDPRLPYGYRAAVFEYKPPAGRFVNIGIPGGASGLVTALDRSGHVIAEDSSGPPAEPTRSWPYPGRPAAGTCSLSPRPGTGLETGSGTIVTSIVAAPAIVGEAFLPCIDTDLYLARGPRRVDQAAGPGTRLLAAVLLNATDPGARPADLPDMRTVAGHPGIYDRPGAELPTLNVNPGLTAKRVADAWLVVAGGAGTGQRITALDDLAVGSVTIAGLPSTPAATAGALCHIGNRPLGGMPEITQTAITTTRRTATSSLMLDQRRSLRGLQVAVAQLHHDETQSPRDAALVAGDQARVSLEQQADLSRFTLGRGLVAPTCATATFYSQQQWPMTATLILATKNCPGPRVFVPCDKLRPAWRRSIARVLRPVLGQPQEFTVPRNISSNPAETVKQIDKWWLVIDGGKNPQQQQLLLRRLTTTVAPSLNRTLRNTIATPLTFCARQNPTAC